MAGTPTITALRVETLMRIGDHQENALSLHILVIGLKRRKANVVKTVEDLVAGGLVRKKLEDDRVYLGLTPKGRDVYEAALAPPPREVKIVKHVKVRSLAKILRGES